jgi:cysteine sulfinate desulfinase/cysteine desulfurase-like protein
MTYLAHAATMPMLPEAVAARCAELAVVGNPSSLHAAGRRAGRRVEEAREQLAAAVRAQPAADARRLRVLAIEDASAALVGGIFAEYLDGRADRAIANSLNRDGIPCPSAPPRFSRSEPDRIVRSRRPA